MTHMQIITASPTFVSLCYGEWDLVAIGLLLIAGMQWAKILETSVCEGKNDE